MVWTFAAKIPPSTRRRRGKAGVARGKAAAESTAILIFRQTIICRQGKRPIIADEAAAVDAYCPCSDQVTQPSTGEKRLTHQPSVTARFGRISAAQFQCVCRVWFLVQQPADQRPAEDDDTHDDQPGLVVAPLAVRVALCETALPET